MEVVKDNYNKTSKAEYNSYPRELTCDRCGSILKYDKSDIRIGYLGCAFVDCVLCGNDNFLEDENCITLTKNNVEFPTHFHHTSADTGAKNVCNNETIKEKIKTAINYFRVNKDEFYWSRQFGNLHISVCRYSGDENYEVHVTNDFYNVYIPFEEEDYDKDDEDDWI